MNRGAVGFRYTRNQNLCALAIACVFGLLAGAPSCRERQVTSKSSEGDLCVSDLAAPDLSQCARIEIRFHPSAIGYFLSGGLDPSNLVSPEEHQYLLSLEKAVITDAARIRSLAHQISAGVYRGPSGRGKPRVRQYLEVTCHYQDGREQSLTFYGATLMTDDGHSFDYKRVPLKLFAPTELLEALTLRLGCAYNLKRLAGKLEHDDSGRVNLPPPNAWGDFIMRKTASKNRASMFRCPASGAAERSDYAMNIDCSATSRTGTVLLFEAKGGWNQSGGPELFTFDHHSPRGGLVLLNDGTVKFIRTEEEVKQLRWK
jgi:hypothetical protein